MSRTIQLSTALLLSCVAWLMPSGAAAAPAPDPVTFEDVSAMPAATGANLASGNYTFSSSAQAVLDSETNATGDPFQIGKNHYLVFGATSGYGLSFTRSDGRAFSLQGMDSAGWYQGNSAPWSVTVTGYYANAGAITSTLTVASNSFSSFAASSFSGFNNLLSVSIIGTQPAGGYYLALDNIITTAVPEPEIYVLLLAGLVLLGMVARRRSQSPSP